MSFVLVDEWICRFEQERISSSRALRTLFALPARREPTTQEQDEARRERLREERRRYARGSRAAV